MRPRQALLWRMRWLIVAIALGSANCDRARALAELETRQGRVERNQAQAPQSWNAAEPGTDFYLGDAIRTAQASSASLRLDGGGRLTVRQNSVVRFASRRPNPKNKAFELETGQALLEAGDAELALIMEIGTAHLAARSQLLLSRTGTATLQFDVTVGRAQIETTEGDHEVAAGQSFTVSVGRAVIEHVDAGIRARTEAMAAADAIVTNNLPGTDPGTLADPTGTASTTGLAVLVSGSGVTSKGPANDKFERVDPGETRIPFGTTLRIDKHSEVALQRDHARVVLMGAGDYHLGSNDGQLEIRSGSASVTGPIRIQLPGGLIETREDTLAVLDVMGKRRGRLRVNRGSATLSSEQRSMRVAAGEAAELNPDGSIRIDGRGLNYADITILAGESLTIHDPLPPTAVRFRFGSTCPAGSVIREGSQSKKQFATGTDATSLALDVGRHEYYLHCLDDQGISADVAARGTVNILRDAGTRPVPDAPPISSVAVDGRNYTILYQNQLPSVNVVWPGAPDAVSYQLLVKSRNGTKSYPSKAPRYSFRSGALSEGLHTIHFEGGDRTSRHTEVTISFDNAAPTASLMTPVNPKISPTGEVVLLGVAQPGWRVEVGDQEVVQDAQRRFRQPLAASAGERAVAVRLVHPTRGTHVYLRRVSKP